MEDIIEGGGELSTPLLLQSDTAGKNISAPSEVSTSQITNISNASSANRLPPFESHFTLRIPTSTVHFRGNLLRVIDTDHDQIILQETLPTVDSDDKRSKILVKRLSPDTYAQRFLRIGYTLITILFVGFLFVFCFQVLLFLFIALPVDSGYTSGNSQVDLTSVISTLFSIPVMLHGMSSLMAMGSAFVVDTYNGAALFRSTFVEIYYMLVFLIVPILAFAISLMARVDEPWRRAAGSWAVMVAFTFVIWGLAVTYREIKACFWIVERYFCQEESDEYSIHTSTNSSEESQDARVMKEWKRIMKIAKRSLLLTQTARYSGVKKQRFNVLEGKRIASSFGHEPLETYIDPYTRFISLSIFSKLRLFHNLDEPKRIYSSEEVREILPFITRENWSMSKMWCAGDSRQHNVLVARGQSALTPYQVKLSVLCTITSSVAITLILIGLLVFAETGVGLYIAVAVVALLCCIVPFARNGLEMYRLYDGVNNDSLGVDEEDGAGKRHFTFFSHEPRYCCRLIFC